MGDGKLDEFFGGPLPSIRTFSDHFLRRLFLFLLRKRDVAKWRRFHGKESSPLEAIRELG